jgi:organic hydroperoxide reductase OsmC/OhrA
MSLYHATVRWRREGDFLAGKYSRVHDIDFDGLSVKGTASLNNVPAPMAIHEAVDPEELFVAALSTCHMLWFLDLARHAGIVIETYEDAAEGVLAKDAEGKIAMTKVTLMPRVDSSASAEQLAAVHHDAHERCFIANSVKSQVLIEPR